MLIYDGVNTWEGWGGKLRLGHGKCRLRIYDLNKEKSSGLTHIRPIVVVVSDLPNSNVSVQVYSSHIATGVTKKFSIDPNRMIWVEYYPEIQYGVNKERSIPERFDEVEFTWIGDKAIRPKWCPLESPMLDIIKRLVNA